ncbi:ubiquitin carboxyl-terminal hydrolase 34-like isoform X3 [Branchiostoma lanceolatum]|uniref:ubiquitin carboxyl-terminal hydrolase 34-like isoform X3 n=1 Tax=Branchiostoma lanceolatum TaxID=7740 RepID=UPI0034539E4D
MCDVCVDLLGILQSYEGRMIAAKPPRMNKDEALALVGFIQTWQQKQCGCCFKDARNVEKFNLLLQGLILVALNIIKTAYQEVRARQECSSSAKQEVTQGKAEEEKQEEENKEEVVPKKQIEEDEAKTDQDNTGDVAMPEETTEETAKEEADDKNEVEREVEKDGMDVRWTLEEREGLLHCVAKIYQMQFPLYTSYKHYFHLSVEDLSQQEGNALGNYCDMNDVDVPVYLLKNVYHMCEHGGLLLIRQCFEQVTPELLPFPLAHAMVALVSNVRVWLHLPAVMQYILPMRPHVIRYLIRLSEKDLRMTGARNMADLMWSAVKEPLDSQLGFDRDSLELAFKYFTSPTLTMRLAGLSQVTNQVHVFTEMCNNDSMVDVESNELAEWLVQNKIVEHIFGPNMHIELVKQSQMVLNFMAAESCLTSQHLDCIWAAAQLKHSSKYVHEVISALIKHLEPALLKHLLKLVSSLHPSQHTEQTLYLASMLTKVIWSNALSAHMMQQSQQASQPAFTQMLKSTLDKASIHRQADQQSTSSGDNSVSAEPSHSGGSDAEQENEHMHHHHHHVHHHHGEGRERRQGHKPGHRLAQGHVCHHHHLHQHYMEMEDHEPSSQEESSLEQSLDVSRETQPSAQSDGSSSGEEGESGQEGSFSSEHSTHSQGSDGSRGSEGGRSEESSTEVPRGRQHPRPGRKRADSEQTESISSEEEDSPKQKGSKSQKKTVKSKKGSAEKKRLAKGVAEESMDVSEKGEEKEKAEQVATVPTGEKTAAENEDEEDDDPPTITSTPQKKDKDCSELTQEEQMLSQPSHSQDMLEDSMETEIYDCRGFIHHTRSNLMEDILSPDEISCSSSQISNKSEKNMADFEGEDSGCEEELAQINAHAQLSSQMHQHLANMASMYHSHLPHQGHLHHHHHHHHQSPGRHKKHANEFNFEEVCKPTNTLLWELVQDHSAVHLGEGLAVEAEKLLCSLVCWFTDRQIRMRFIEGCLENLANNSSVVVSLRLLPKLFGSFQQYRNTYDTHWITMWAEEQRQMMHHFFNNLVAYTTSAKEGKAPKNPLYTHMTEVQARLQFLTFVFSSLASPETFRLTLEQVDTLWNCLATDPEVGDEALNWFLNQARNKDQHAMSLDTFKHIFVEKMPGLQPETITMTGLNLFQQLCTLARMVSPSPDMPALDDLGMQQLWGIALRARDPDVSQAAIQYINNFYINAGNGNLEREHEFVKRCMDSLLKVSATLNRCPGSSLLVLERGLDLLKSHLEVFRRRYTYHMRMWQLQGRGILSHQKYFNNRNNSKIHVVCQPAGMTDKLTIEMDSQDLVADLRAEVTHWFEHLSSQGQVPSSSQDSSAAMAALFGSSLQGPVRMISQGRELTAENMDEKTLQEMGFKDLQLVFVSVGNPRPQSRRQESFLLPPSLLPEPPRDNLPMLLLLQEPHFDNLMNLLQLLSTWACPGKEGDSEEVMKAKLALENRGQLLSHKVWELLMLLPTCRDLLNAFTRGIKKLQVSPPAEAKDPEAGGSDDQLPADHWSRTLGQDNPHKLLYCLQIIESLSKPRRSRHRSSTGSQLGGGDQYSVELELPVEGLQVGPAWTQHFISTGGLQHLLSIFMSGCLQAQEGKRWSEWQQDTLALLLKLLYHFAMETLEITPSSEDSVFEADTSGDYETPRKRSRHSRGKKSTGDHEKSSVPKIRSSVLQMMDENPMLERLMSVLYEAAAPSDASSVLSVYWGKSEVVRHGMRLLVSWVCSVPEVANSLARTKQFQAWLQRLVLDAPEPTVRREACSGLYKLCMSTTSESHSFIFSLLSALLSFLSAAQLITPPLEVGDLTVVWTLVLPPDDEKGELYGPGCKDYFWLLCRLVDHAINPEVLHQAEEDNIDIVDVDALARHLAKCISVRKIHEQRHNTVDDDALCGLLRLGTAVVKHNPPFKYSKHGQELVKVIFECLFKLPTMEDRDQPKCKSQNCRSAAYDLMVELVKGCLDNYKLLHGKMMAQHTQNVHAPYPWNYWPHEDGRSPCGFVGLTNLGATCYMASCIQQLYMMPQLRAAILASKVKEDIQNVATLMELQRMFAFLLESERKAYNPRNFCKVYTMDKQPINTGEQKDMTEFFTDLITKLEEMGPELKDTVKKSFGGVITNNVVSLDCTHVSRNLEEFYTVRCQVADMKNLYESLDEVTVKDTLEGDNMYTCSQCGKKVRAEKRACFKKLPRYLCFNTMRYTFNMVTMMKEKVNTHFSFPPKLDMSVYTEDYLMGEEGSRQQLDGYEYELIGVTVHTGTADGGHYYSFIRDRIGSGDKWYLFNDAEVKQFDSTQLASECFGGEMTTKTYDSVTDKFMDFSFEKTHSAYMLFYERCQPEEDRQREMPQKFDLSKDLSEWIWQDNMQFLQDKSIFEHTYFNFMWQMCSYIPTTLPDPSREVSLLSAKLTASFVLETLIHSKEKPTMLQWIELLTKHFNSNAQADEWFLDHMAQDDWWPMQILIKCPNQMMRQMFQRLVAHVINQLRPRHAPLYLQPVIEGEGSVEDIGCFSCVTRFIKMLLSLLEHGVRPNSKHLTEYFSLLLDFAQKGEEEKHFMIAIEAISIMANFYLGNKSPDYVEVVSEDEEEEEDDDVITLPEEKYRPTSLEKMIALVALLVETSRAERQLSLSQNDLAVLTTGKGFPFLYQQVRDNINLRQTCNLIFSLTRYNPRLAEAIVSMIFHSIGKLNPDGSQPFFKLLSMLVEFLGGPPGMPSFTQLILNRIWDVTEYNPQQCFDWLAIQTPRNKLVHSWVLQSMETWAEMYLLASSNIRVRNSAGFLLASLVPNNHFRQMFRSARNLHSPNKDIMMTPEATAILHQVYSLLLRLLGRARIYADHTAHGTVKLVQYFALMTYCLVSRTEKLMLTRYVNDLWQVLHPKLTEPAIPINHNKQALLLFWHHACVDCPENIQLIIQNAHITKNIPFNYILADHDDQEVVVFNRGMLPAYYAILRMCCQMSAQFARQLASHQNMQWAFKNLTPHANQYPVAVEELFHLMQLFVARRPEMTKQEQQDIAAFKRATLNCYLNCLEGRSCWTTLISAFRILLESDEDRLQVACNKGLSLMCESFNTLHLMFHEATACHVTGDLVELLAILYSILDTCTKYMDKKEVKQSLLQWQEKMELGRKLMTLLNSYTPPEVRQQCFEVLQVLVSLCPRECTQSFIPILQHAHANFQRTNVPVTLGPFFPHRGTKAVPNKANIRPPRPDMQMFLHPNQAEAHRGEDENYDRAMDEFFYPYHKFIDILCRVAANQDLMPDAFINLSALVAYEGVPLHYTFFPQLWLDIYNSQHIDKTYIKRLMSSPAFADYVDAILMEERVCLNNNTIFSFFAIFFPRIHSEGVCSQQVVRQSLLDNVVTAIVAEKTSIDTATPDELLKASRSLNGDLRELSLLLGVLGQTPLSPMLLPSLQHILATGKRYQQLRDGVAGEGAKEEEEEEKDKECQEKDKEEKPSTSQKGTSKGEGKETTQDSSTEGESDETPVKKMRMSTKSEDSKQQKPPSKEPTKAAAKRAHSPQPSTSAAADQTSPQLSSGTSESGSDSDVSPKAKPVSQRSGQRTGPGKAQDAVDLMVKLIETNLPLVAANTDPATSTVSDDK